MPVSTNDAIPATQNMLRRRLVRNATLCIVCLLIGCGVSEYEERLDTTAKYFASIELQNANLHGAWLDEATTISFRLPLQFGMIPAPEGLNTDPFNSDAGSVTSTGVSGDRLAVGTNVGKDEEEEEEEEEEPANPRGGFNQPGNRPAQNQGNDEEIVDTRQPAFLTEPLPGLRGAFRANVSVISEGGRTAVGSGYVYILSNHHLSGNQEFSSRFGNDVVAQLARMLEVKVKAESAREVKLPSRPDAFMKPISYTEIELEPSEQGDAMAREFGVATRFSVYLYAEGEVQVVVLFVLPRDLDSAEKMSVRRPLSLESLRIANPSIAKPAGGGTIGGGEAGNRGGF